MEFSYPLAIESFKLLVPKPEEESHLFAFVRPFQFSVKHYTIFWNHKSDYLIYIYKFISLTSGMVLPDFKFPFSPFTVNLFYLVLLSMENS